MTKAIVAPLRSGLKSTELYLGVAATILMAIWPDFPKESFLAIAAFVVARSGQKMFGFAEGKRAWESSEFYLTMGVTVLSLVFPDFPQEALFGVIGWTGLRTAAKVKQK